MATAAQSQEDVSRNVGIEMTASLDIGRSVEMVNSIAEEEEQKVDDTDAVQVDENGDPLPTVLKVKSVLYAGHDTTINDMLDLVIERDEDKNLRKMRYKQTKDERRKLQENVFVETLSRLTECTKGKFEARFGDEDMKRKPEYNLNYCMGPAKELQDQYNKLVDDAQYEINSLHQMIDSKKLDIAKLIKENNKFLCSAGEKYSWKQYEKTLAVERVMNERLINQLVKHRNIDQLVTEG